MPDYLSPGVYIEELPPALQAIQGVSTSIAGFVGAAQRGPVAGFPPPAAVPGSPQAPSASLVTSFADFTRQYSAPLPLPDPNNNAYLAYAVKGFFDNGGAVCYVSRVVATTQAGAANPATYSSVTVDQGTVLSLARSFTGKENPPVLYLNSLRGINTGPNLTLYSRSGAVSPQQLTVASYDSRAKSVTLTAPAQVVAVSDAYLIPSAAPPTPGGPTFWAQNPGAWSTSLSVLITPSDRPAVTVVTAGVGSAQQITVTNAGSFYVGASIEIDSQGVRTYHEVQTLLPGGVIQLTAQIGRNFDAATLVRVVEIDITISDPTATVATSETYTGLAWNPDAGAQRYYAAVINAASNLVYVQPPAGESAQITTPPTTANGFASSPLILQQARGAATSAVAVAVVAINGLVAAVQAVAAAPALPLAAADPLIAAINAANQAVTNATANLQSPALPANAITVGQQATAAVTAARAAVAAATAAGATAATVTPHLQVAEDAQAAAAAAQTALGAVPAAGTLGSDGAPPQDGDYVGIDDGPGARTGIQALVDIEYVSIIAAPGRTSVTVQAALIDQCQLLQYRFAVLDGKSYPNGLQVNDVLAQRDNYDTSYAALYVPWLQITLNNQNVYIPPSGHVVGVYAGTDNSRGVWKAPANVVVQNITGLQSYIVTGEQDILNPAGVDCIRRFDQLGIRVWGARTISSDDSLMYVNVRRTLIFLEASIDQGTQWVVFEPNDPDTWGRVVDSVTAFLMTQWTNGALFGDKPSDAFFVRCDLTTMTADDIQNGRLICLIGVAIVRPAEFVIFRIEQITGLATTQ
jgi:phage tail sheath protein FI